ncbi:MAG: hypothetical protein QM541_13150, partial [Flavobacterium sp.]|nr:hypothetical protein [Flavobacterium sp.]
QRKSALSAGKKSLSQIPQKIKKSSLRKKKKKSARISVICGQKKSLADCTDYRRNKKIFSQKEEKKSA